MFDIKRINQELVASIPLLVCKLNHLAPQPLQARLLSLVFNQFFRAELAQGDLAFLAGKTVVIEISDYQLCFALSLVSTSRQSQLVVTMTPTQQDLLIKAKSPDFLAMMNNTVDPDTLFFRRQLLLLGDTELGLYCKNLLDGIEISRLPNPLPQWLNWLVQQQMALAKAAPDQYGRSCN